MSTVPREPSEVVFTPWRPNSWVLTVAGAALGGIMVGAGFGTLRGGSVGGNEYHLWRWQADTLASTVFSLAGIGADGDGSSGDTAIESYFRLTSEIRGALEAETPDVSLVDTLTSERAVYENDVERTLEERIDEAVTSAGLGRDLPLFNGVTITWPPVNFELTSPPQLLVRSPRDRIERAGDTLLKNDLSLRQIEEIEADASSEDTASLVVSIGGLAAYPAIVRDDRSYASLLDTASHEWVHHYLAFYPLGETWGQGGDAETLNETTANIAGRAIADAVNAARPVSLPEGEDGRAPPAPAPTVDFNEVMRALRLEVDALLADGEVEEAEARMEAVRLYLADNGIHIRKINQAYFAFYGTYADGPASSNPVGPKIERVWELTGEVGTFLSIMREITTVDELDRSLAALERAASGD